jgi:nitroimidazol reductase NimA-like FMN-containing flavoprotein (pyridoxamine 5'-phosphate oxidase superfamily)
MTPDEIDAFLSSQRVCRVATIGARDRTSRR